MAVKTFKHLDTETPAGEEEAVSPKSRLLMEVYVHIVWGKVFTNASEKKNKIK